MKPNRSSMRQFGQATIPSSFLFKSRLPNENTQAKPSKRPISLSDFLDRKLSKTNSRSLRGEQSSFLSIGSDKKCSGTKRDELGSDFTLDRAVFRQFNVSTKEECYMEKSNSGEVGESQSESSRDGQDSRKRKNPFGAPSGEDETSKYLVVLGDDPKPKPKKGQDKFIYKKTKPFYNHYESGSGWWDCDREGVDSEEVGCNEVWEGMGSTTLGGLEWH